VIPIRPRKTCSVPIEDASFFALLIDQWARQQILRFALVKGYDHRLVRENLFMNIVVIRHGFRDRLRGTRRV
jgi:hypothetical protein